MATDSASAKKKAYKLKGYAGLAVFPAGFFLLCWGLGSLFDAGGFFGALFFLSLAVCVGCWLGSKAAMNESKALDEKEKNQREQERKDREEVARKAAQARERDYALQRMKSVHQRAIDLKQSIPALIQAANSHLDLAEQEYRRTAFSPFWQAIEGATTRLGELSENLNQFTTLTEDHKKIDGELQSAHQLYADRFPVRLVDIYTAEEGQVVGERMDVLVGRALTDYQFSTIYEQRRTSSILIAGFSSLGNAIAGMTAKISSDLVSVVRSLDSVRGSVDSVRGSVDSAAYASASQSAEAIQMLDNIQRRRLPYGQATPRDY